MAEQNAVEAYYAAQPDDQRATLEHMRGVIRVALPEATEAISYGLPTFKHKGRAVLAIGAWKNHCALYPMSYAVMAAHQAELAAYDVSKGTVRFKANQPLDDDLLRAIVAERVAENDARQAKR